MTQPSPAQAPSEPLPELTYQSYFRVLDAAPGASLVVFTAPGCGACRAMLRALRDLRGEVSLALYRVAAEENPGLVEELEIFHLPALFLYRDGREHGSIQAAPRPRAVWEAVEAGLARGPLPDD